MGADGSGRNGALNWTNGANRPTVSSRYFSPAPPIRFPHPLPHLLPRRDPVHPPLPPLFRLHGNGFLFLRHQAYADPAGTSTHTLSLLSLKNHHRSVWPAWIPAWKSVLQVLTKRCREMPVLRVAGGVRDVLLADQDAEVTNEHHAPETISAPAAAPT